MFFGGRLAGSTWTWIDGTPWLAPTPWWNGIDCGGGSPSPQGDGQTLQTFCQGTAWDDRGPEGGGNLDKALIEYDADCNADGIVDYGQILEGTLTDVSADGIPDVCQAPCVPADLNNDRSVDGADLGVLLSAWGPAGPESARADINGNGIVDGADLGVLLANWGACGEAPPWATVVQWQPDPAVVTDPALRAAIIATGRPWRVRDTGTQVEMLLVPPGTFQMGCIIGSNRIGCYGWEQPSHLVTLTNAFYLGRYEVTQSQWVATMGSNPSYFQGQSDSPSRPVERVNWNTILGYLTATGFRLPTEAEWEYACRAWTQTPFYNGSTDDNTVGTLAWFYYNTCEGGFGCGARPVGGKFANALGFHDMLGNVWEWANDWYAGYSSSFQTDPTGPVYGYERVLRGGSWNDPTSLVRSSSRTSGALGLTRPDIGFRVARNP
jgi:formylglycine-generating enzyme required for sulfatase activity